MKFEYCKGTSLWGLASLFVCVWESVSACRCTGCVKDEPRRRAVHLALWLFLYCAFPMRWLRNDLGDRDRSLFVVSISHNWASVPEGQVYRIRTGLHNTENTGTPLMPRKGCVRRLSDWGRWLISDNINLAVQKWTCSVPLQQQTLYVGDFMLYWDSETKFETRSSMQLVD